MEQTQSYNIIVEFNQSETENRFDDIRVRAKLPPL